MLKANKFKALFEARSQVLLGLIGQAIVKFLGNIFAFFYNLT
jgi:hypothetical protein